MRKRHKKRTRKYNLFNAMYTGYKREFNKAERAGKLRQGEQLMTQEEFYSMAVMSGATYTDKEGILRFDPAALRKISAQAISTATGTLTAEQARHLKAKLVKMEKAGWKPKSLAGRDISSIAVSQFRSRKDLVGEIYRELVASGMDISEANDWISSEIFGS